MTAETPTPPVADAQGDRLLWLAAGVVGAIGITWLVMSKPWSSDAALEVDNTPLVIAEKPVPPARLDDAGPRAALDNPLRMAQLAYEAGMLVEPEDYSAWTLFAGVLAEQPDNATALHGLEAVSEELLQRAAVALEQGRFDAADESVARILAVLPEHGSALLMAEDIERSKPTPAPPVVIAPPEPTPAPARQSVAVTPPAIQRAPAAPPVDPMLEPHAAFETAMRENRLLTPAGDNAKHYVEALLALDDEHELTQAAQALLSEELLARSKQALEALDPDGARSWIDAASDIALDRSAVLAAEAMLADKLIAMESAKTLPASSLSLVSYVAPEYPSRALERLVQGWVDVEFTVDTDGSVSEVTVADASHDRWFRDEAVDAVLQWRFAPRQFMGRAIEQRSYTRLRFTLE